MSKNAIFDITNMVCPLCKKTHTVKRVGFNFYEMVCWVHEKELDMVMNNHTNKKRYDWRKWVNNK